MTYTDILMLAVLPLLLLFSAFFSGGETALFSLTRHQRLRLSRSPSIAASAVTRLVDARQALLVTLLLGNMFVNVLYFVIGTVLILGLQERALSPTVGNLLNIAAVLLLILVGEVLPKLVAARFAMAWSTVAAVPLMIFFRGLTPLRVVLQTMLVEPVSRLLSPRHRPHGLSAAELETMLELSQKRGVIDDEEEQMLQQVLSLGHLKVRDLMTPRVDIVAFEVNDDPAKLVAMVKQRRFSRIPVYRSDLDHIEGIVYTRQVLLAGPRTAAQVKALIRQVNFVPELQASSTLLVELRKRGTTIAITVDEYGGTAGMVTLEDVVEHMVGDIPGSQIESQPPHVQAIGHNQWRISADLSVGEWAEEFGRVHAIPGISTIGGLVMAQLGRIPNVGDRTTLRNLSIVVETMDRHRINTLRLELLDGAVAPVGGQANP